MAVGGSEHIHRLKVGAVLLQLRFDPAARVVHIQDQSIALGDANVVLLDGVDTPNRLTVVGTVRIDPRFPSPTTGDPVEQIVRNSPGLSMFVQ